MILFSLRISQICHQVIKYLSSLIWHYEHLDFKNEILQIMPHLTTFYLRFIYKPFKRSIHWEYLSLASVGGHTLQKSFWEAGIALWGWFEIYIISGMHICCTIKCSNCSCRKALSCLKKVFIVFYEQRIGYSNMSLIYAAASACHSLLSEQKLKRMFSKSWFFSQIIHYWKIFYM